MTDNKQLLELTADIVAAHVSNNTVAVGDLSSLIAQVHQALGSVGEEKEPEPSSTAQKRPVVTIKASVKPDYLVCLDCGAKQKTLKRHLMTAHGMSPQQYRTAYGLSKLYPLVAPSYSEKRSGMAKALGLGRKKGERQPTKPKLSIKS